MKTNRDTEGRFTHKLSRLCVCGHKCGDHTAVRAKHPSSKGWLQPCIECDCECFTPAKKESK